ncbi:hypothetical protein KDA_74280 [Dictyobacter alpinus]|uniref:Uncharacterized protein n=1 Tax=Dictyobacter alpinus TaxID=2014873 RepID=A0A402BKR8_9CHLR|nr:hypothetical protein [Dictyobacter alpinus]GCE31944.1 hypothetical protein KDA_74280 [Dictyobacter alpinus]
MHPEHASSSLALAFALDLTAQKELERLEKELGLGLSICKMLIAQHHGEVGVESTPGEG